MYNKENKKGLKTGIWRTFYKNGVIESEGRYCNGSRVGVWSFYTSRRRLTSTGVYRRGKKQGTWKHYSIWSKKVFLDQIDKYKNGKLNGLCVNFYDNGKLCEKIHFKDGVRTGFYEGFHRNGKKNLEGLEIRGRRVNHWKYYDSKGKFEKETIFI